MLAIAGAILIHAACILMATTKESADIYPMRLFLIVVGAGLIGADLANRILEFFKKARESARTPKPEPLYGLQSQEGARRTGTE